MLADVEEKIKNGIPLSEAFEAQGMFPRIYTASILAGEKSGALDDVLARFVTYLKRSVGVSRKLRGALGVSGISAARGDDDGGVSDALHRSANVGPFQEPELRTATLPTVTLVVLAYLERHRRAISGGSLPLVLIVGLGLYVWLRTTSGKLMLHQAPAEDPDRRAADPQHGDGAAVALAVDAAFGRHHGSGFVGDLVAGDQ